MTYYKIVYYCIFHLLFPCPLFGYFSPKLEDYDAYGVKIAMNDHFLVLAQNTQSSRAFLLQYAPYNYVNATNQCSLPFPDRTSMFIYTVSIGRDQTSNQKHFFYAGEYIGNQTKIFVGKAVYNQNGASSVCDPNQYSYSTLNLSYTEHQDLYLISANPNGTRVYGFSNKFLFVYMPDATPSIDTWSGNLTWPDPTFIPHAVEMMNTYGVVSGFIKNPVGSRAEYSPIIYLLNLNSSTGRPQVVHSDKPIPTADTWQDLLENRGADLYSAKYDMSVAINETGHILVGMQFINRVFFLSVNAQNPVLLRNMTRHTNGRSLGNGKSIVWLPNGMASVIVNTYSLSYQWSLSQVYFFDIKEDGYYNSTSIPISVFPNSHQTKPEAFGSVFLNVVASKSGDLALLNDQGQIILFSSVDAGYYPQIDDSVQMPYVTKSQSCTPGSFKARSGVHACSLCPTGTKNLKNSTTKCVRCLTTSFCPLGAVDDVSMSVLKTTSQVKAYPHSPESTIYEEILIQNMFKIKSGRCLTVSPLFWALIVSGVGILIGTIIEIVSLCSKRTSHTESADKMKYALKHTDLVGEGEYWIGGLASFAVIVLISFSYAFSSKFLDQYPIETSSDSYFACDLSLRNAKFDTNALSLAIPFEHEEQEIVDLLNEQHFKLHVDLINTEILCDKISIQGLFGTLWQTIRWESCTDDDSILSLLIPLPAQFISIEISIADEATVGGIRVGFHGEGHYSKRHNLKELNVYRSFWKIGKVLANSVPISVAMTKIINQTKDITGEESDYSAIYIPTFSTDPDVLFITNDQYVRSPETSSKVLITITETSYFVKNVQQPIAHASEVIFRTIIFTVVVLEIFGLLFLIYKLILKPFYSLIKRKIFGSCSKKSDKEKKEKPYEDTSPRFSVIPDNGDAILTNKF